MRKWFFYGSGIGCAKKILVVPAVYLLIGSPVLYNALWTMRAA